MLSIIKSPRTVNERVTAHLRNYNKLTIKTVNIIPFHTSPFFCKNFPEEALVVMTSKPLNYVNDYFNQTLAQLGEYSTQVNAFIARLNLLIKFVSEEQELLKEHIEILAIMHNPNDTLWACKRLRDNGYIDHATAVSEFYK